MTKILIIKPSSLGDILHALQVVESLRQRMGEGTVEITWVVREIFEPLVAATETVQRTIVYNRKEGLLGIWKLGRRLRKERFDIVLDMQGLARSGFWTLCAKAPLKLGRGDAREGARFCADKLTAAPAGGFKHAHAVDILAQFLPMLGFSSQLIGSVKFTGASLSEAIEKKLRSREAILLFPDSRRAEKEWPYFVELTRLLLLAFPQNVVCWVGQSALVPAEDYATDGRFINLMGQTKLLDVPALIARAKFCVTNDSGPMHIAAAMNVPVLGIFGPTSPELYGPFPPTRENNRVLVAPDGDLKKLPATVVADNCKMFFA
ncbi:MAG: glycosyltransferase family 9 protein [Opitutales bacterium]|nr:glycosyltransferase family 9 protein [Opitutales bacterium]